MTLSLRHLVTSPALWPRLLRFAVVGGMTGLAFAAIVAVMVELFGLRAPLAAGGAYALLLPLNFAAHKAAVFRSRHPVLAEWMRYLGMHALTLVLSMAVMAVVTDAAELPHVIGSVAVIAAAPVVNLVLMDLWVFRNRHAPTGDPRA